MEKNLLGALLKMERLKQNREQKDVAFGVCVPSYLSKIEHGQVKPEENILRLLFQKLHIDYQEERFIVETHQKKILEYFERLHYGLDCHEIYSELEKYQEQLSYSVLAIDWYLIKAFEKKQDIQLLYPLQEAMNQRQKSYFQILAFMQEKSKDLKELEEACKNLGNSYGYFVLCAAYMEQSDYGAIHRIENQVITLAIEEGNTYQLASYFLFKGSAYACFNQHDMMMVYYERSIKLLQNTGWTELLQEIYYNMGATYINLKEYELSKKYLDLVIKRDNEEDFSLLHKKALVHICSGNIKQGQEFLKIIKEKYLNNPGLLNEADQLKYEEAVFECEEDFISKPQYLDLLENLRKALEKEYHFGHLYFYADIIVETYAKHRKYKKALEFQERISYKIQNRDF